MTLGCVLLKTRRIQEVPGPGSMLKLMWACPSRGPHAAAAVPVSLGLATHTRARARCAISDSTDSWGSCAARRLTGTACARTWTPRPAPGASSTGSWGSWTTWGRPGNRARRTATAPRPAGGGGGGCTRPTTDDAGSPPSRTGRRRSGRRRCGARCLRPAARTRPAARCRSADSWGTAPGSGRTGTVRRSAPSSPGLRKLQWPANGDDQRR